MVVVILSSTITAKARVHCNEIHSKLACNETPFCEWNNGSCTSQSEVNLEPKEER